MADADSMVPVKRRVVVHFPGFEPLDAEAHLGRFGHAAQKSGKVWGFMPVVTQTGSDAARVETQGDGWQTNTDFIVQDISAAIAGLLARPLWRQILSGYLHAAKVALAGGLTGYFRTAWRFGLFYVFPFVLMAAMLAAVAALALGPMLAGWPAWSVLFTTPAAVLLFRFVLLPFAGRYHTMLLFSDWAYAWRMATLEEPDDTARIDAMSARLKTALAEAADEHVVSSHSMGSNLAAHALGRLIEDDPHVLDGRRVTFLTLGGANLQSGLLRPAKVLRRRVGAIAAHPAVTWIDVQSLTDIAHFHRGNVTADLGLAGVPAPQVIDIRMKHLLTPETYRRIKRDLLRVHRQYVLGSEARGRFDYSLAVLGPVPAAAFAGFVSGGDVEAALSASR